MAQSEFFTPNMSSAPKIPQASRFGGRTAAWGTGGESPGPGAYNTAQSSITQKGARITSARRFDGTTTTGRSSSVSRTQGTVPGPGFYNTARGSMEVKGPGTFGRTKRDLSLGPKDRTPGPCHYNTAGSSLTTHGVAKISTAPRSSLFENGSRPRSAGSSHYYMPPRSSLNTHGVTSFGKASKDAGMKRSDSTPGPGEYNPHWSNESRYGVKTR